jgi:hypothetical protein
MSDQTAGTALHDSPTEFLSAIANNGGTCDGQAIVPEGDHYLVRCSCGLYLRTAPTRETGIAMARAHAEESD